MLHVWPVFVAWELALVSRSSTAKWRYQLLLAYLIPNFIQFCFIFQLSLCWLQQESLFTNKDNCSVVFFVTNNLVWLLYEDDRYIVSIYWYISLRSLNTYASISTSNTKIILAGSIFSWLFGGWHNITPCLFQVHVSCRGPLLVTFWHVPVPNQTCTWQWLYLTKPIADYIKEVPVISTDVIQNPRIYYMFKEWFFQWLSVVIYRDFLLNARYW